MKVKADPHVIGLRDTSLHAGCTWLKTLYGLKSPVVFYLDFVFFFWWRVCKLAKKVN